MSSADNTEQEEGSYLGSQPSDLELVECHLRPWVATGRKAAASSFLHETDVYAEGPADLVRKFAPAVALDGQRAWYFLTRLQLRSARGRGTRFARTVRTGAGCWHSEARERPVVDVVGGGRHAGRRQFLAFMTVDGHGKRVRTGWIMSELRLGPGDDDRGGEQDLRVLCKVYRSPRHPDTKPSELVALEANDDDDDQSRSATTTAAPAPARNVTKAPTDKLGCAETSAPAREGDVGESSAAAERKRKATDDVDKDESSGASRGKRTAADGNRSAATTGLHCPNCGFHIDAAHAGTGDSETENANQGGDSSVRDHTFYKFL